MGKTGKIRHGTQQNGKTERGKKKDERRKEQRKEDRKWVEKHENQQRSRIYIVIIL